MRTNTKILILCLLTAIATANLVEDATNTLESVVSALKALSAEKPSDFQFCFNGIDEETQGTPGKISKGCGMCDPEHKRAYEDREGDVRYFLCVPREIDRKDDLKFCAVPIASDPFNPFPNQGCYVCKEGYEIAWK